MRALDFGEQGTYFNPCQFKLKLLISSVCYNFMYLHSAILKKLSFRMINASLKSLQMTRDPQMNIKYFFVKSTLFRSFRTVLIISIISLLINVRRSDDDYISALFLQHPHDEYYIIINHIIPDIVTIIICIIGHIAPCLILFFCLIIMNMDPWTPLIRSMQSQGRVPPAPMIKNTLAYYIPYQFMAYLLIIYIITYLVYKIYAIHKNHRTR